MRSHSRAVGQTFLFGLALALAGCGGGGNNAARDTTAPTVASTTPAADATDVASNTVVAVTFSEAVDCATVTTSSITLKDAGDNAVSGSVACSGSSATFTPDGMLTDGIQYTATVTTGAADAAGNALAANYVWHFSTLARAWSTAAPLDSTQAFDLNMAFDADGNGIAVWKGVAGFDSHIYAQRYDAVTGWVASAEVINTATIGAHPQIAFLPDGKAIAVWAENPAPPGGHVGINIYTPGSGWGTPTSLGDGFNYGAAIVADSQGNAVVLWTEADGAWTSRYSAGTWSTPYQLSSASYPGDATVAADAAGNAMALWIEDTMSDSTLWYSRYDASNNTWAAAQLFDSVAAGSSRNHSVGIDANGNYLVVWQQSTADEDNIFWRRFDAASNTWNDAARLNGDGTWGYSPVLAVSANGNAVAVWDEWDGTYDNERAATYTRGTGWSAPQLIDNSDIDTSYVAVTIDDNGNATAIWLGYDDATGDATTLWTNRYTVAAGWGTAAALRENALLTGAHPLLRTDPQGDVTAIWKEDGYVPYTARFE